MEKTASTMPTYRLIADLAEETSGRRPNPQTILRWILKGNAGGVKLVAVNIGGRWHTTPNDYQKFLRQQSEAKALRSVQFKERPHATPEILKAAGLF